MTVARRITTWAAALTMLAAAPAAISGVINLNPIQDNTLYEEQFCSAGSVVQCSNGQGETLFAGNNNVNMSFRSLLKFDIGGAIPAGATIIGASLSLHANRVATADSSDVSIHRATSDWGEGTSVAGGSPDDGGGGAGAAATPGDATWDFAFFDSSLWSSPGGDFVGTASAVTGVGDVGNYSWSSAQMVTDVQAWLDGAVANLGWIMIGDENSDTTAKRFDSRESRYLDKRPLLTVEYDSAVAVPTPDTLVLLGLGFMGLSYGWGRRKAVVLGK